MFGGAIGFQEVVVILVVAVVLFGRRLPTVARSMGQSYQQFRKGLSDLQSTIRVDDDNYNSSSYSSPNYTGLPDYSDSYDVEEEGPDFGPPVQSEEDVTAESAADTIAEKRESTEENVADDETAVADDRLS